MAKIPRPNRNTQVTAISQLSLLQKYRSQNEKPEGLAKFSYGISAQICPTGDDMRPLNLLVLLLAVLNFTETYALDIQTRRHSLCGVESFNPRVDAKCGVEKYFDRVSSACAPIYKSKVDPRICGYDPNRTISRCERIPGSHAPQVSVFPEIELGCPAGYQMKTSPAPKACQNEAFGIAGYNSCRDASHGIESYNSCRLEEFGVENYKSCSFYKTPEELNAYIDATSETLVTYSEVLPSRQGELFARLKSENGMGCTIRKYDTTDALFEDVVKDLKEQFLIIFGYQVEDATLDCRPETLKGAAIKVMLSDIDCDNLSKDAIASLAKPESSSEAQLARFKQTCTLKKSYDALVTWFETKEDETAALISDLAAQADPSAKQRLVELQSKLAQ